MAMTDKKGGTIQMQDKHGNEIFSADVCDVEVVKMEPRMKDGRAVCSSSCPAWSCHEHYDCAPWYEAKLEKANRLIEILEHRIGLLEVSLVSAKARKKHADTSHTSHKKAE